MGQGARRRWGSFPTTADVGIWASAHEPGDLYGALASALMAQVTDLRSVRPREHRSVQVEGSDPTALAVNFLSALLVLQQDEGFLVRRASVRLMGRGPTALVAELDGEPFDAARHPRGVEVKAITLHRSQVDLARGRARLIVDI